MCSLLLYHISHLKNIRKKNDTTIKYLWKKRIYKKKKTQYNEGKNIPHKRKEKKWQMTTIGKK